VICSQRESDALVGELFGAGAGGSVRRARPGRLEAADGGTLFLAHAEDLPVPVQLMLLRFLQERSFERRGGGETLRADVRVIAGARDLEGAVRARRFRADLAQRLAAVHLVLTPLRQRSEDIPILVQAFLEALDRDAGGARTSITPGALERLSAYAWPGNIRGLRATLEGAIAGKPGRTLDLDDLPGVIRGADSPSEHGVLKPGMTVEEAERHLIRVTLAHTRQDKRGAARLLGIGLRTLYRKLARYRMG
jgi:DNA-binding NtrC family response regulator